MNILVTGRDGFIASSLVRIFDKAASSDPFIDLAVVASFDPKVGFLLLSIN